MKRNTNNWGGGKKDEDWGVNEWYDDYNLHPVCKYSHISNDWMTLQSLSQAATKVVTSFQISRFIIDAQCIDCSVLLSCKVTGSNIDERTKKLSSSSCFTSLAMYNITVHKTTIGEGGDITILSLGSARWPWIDSNSPFLHSPSLSYLQFHLLLPSMKDMLHFGTYRW